jgi:hypothetical protein
LVALASLVLPALVVGTGASFLSQVTSVRHALAMVNFVAVDNIDSQYLASVISRLPIEPPPAWIVTGAGYGVVVFALYLVYRITKADLQNPSLWAWGILSATIPFWMSSAWPHYFVYLPFLQVLVLVNLSGLRPSWRRPVLAMWMFSLVFSSIFTAQAVQNWFRYVGFGSLFWSNMFILMAASAILWAKIARRPEAPAPA